MKIERNKSGAGYCASYRENGKLLLADATTIGGVICEMKSMIDDVKKRNGLGGSRMARGQV